MFVLFRWRRGSWFARFEAYHAAATRSVERAWSLGSHEGGIYHAKIAHPGQLESIVFIKAMRPNKRGD